MTILLLSGAADPYALRARRCRAYERVLARLRSYELDLALAGGDHPDSSPLLSLRAQALIGATTRADLARSLRRLVAECTAPRPLFRPPVPLARREIVAARRLIERLAAVLEQPAPLDPQAVAKVDLLLRSGTSPLYVHGGDGALERRLTAVLETLERHPVIPSAA